MSMSLHAKTPISKVGPRDGIAYLAGYEGAGNNPAMFAEYDQGQGVKLHVVGSASLDAFAYSGEADHDSGKMPIGIPG